MDNFAELLASADQTTSSFGPQKLALRALYTRARRNLTKRIERSLAKNSDAIKNPMSSEMNDDTETNTEMNDENDVHDQDGDGHEDDQEGGYQTLRSVGFCYFKVHVF